jgi:hypothetical protein
MISWEVYICLLAMVVLLLMKLPSVLRFVMISWEVVYSNETESRLRRLYYGYHEECFKVSFGEFLLLQLL